MRPTLAYQFVQRVHVVVHSSSPPSHDDWMAYVAHFGQHLPEIQNVFVYSHGGGPDGRQRDALLKLYAKNRRRPPVAIVTPSVFVRMAGNAMSAISGSQLSAFAPSDVDKAFSFLGLTPEQRTAVKAVVVSLSESVGQRGS